MSGVAGFPGLRVVRVEPTYEGSPVACTERVLEHDLEQGPPVGDDAGSRALLRCRFDLEAPDPPGACSGPLGVLVTFEGNAKVAVEDVTAPVLANDPYHRLVAKFNRLVGSMEAPRILEIGSRNRSGNIRRDVTPSGGRYVGLDVLPGENVDVVGDAHELGSLFDPGTFDVVFSMSTFEHLAMPWKVVVEINKVLQAGGTCFATTHQAWPIHEAPWDFWRFSEYSWPCLFNAYTGFEVVEAAMGEPASAVAKVCHPVVHGLAEQPLYLASAALCRKVGESTVAWEVPLGEILGTQYPR